MRAPARRIALGVAAGAVLAVVATSTVSANWAAQQRVAAASVSTGDLGITVDWQGGTTWPAIGPGGTISKRGTVTVTGRGDNLRVGLTADVTNATAFTPYVTRSIRLDDCSGTPGTVLPTAGFPASGGLTPGQQVTVCVRYTLATNAPASLQGQAFSPAVTLQLTQRGAP